MKPALQGKSRVHPVPRLARVFTPGGIARRNRQQIRAMLDTPAVNRRAARHAR